MAGIFFNSGEMEMGERKPFELKNHNKDCLEVLLSRIKSIGRGGSITHSEIEDVTGYDRDSNEFRGFIALLKKHSIRELKTVLFHKEYHELSILTAAEQIELPAIRRSRRAQRQFLMCVREVACTPDENLTVHQRNAKSQRLGMLKVRRREALRTSRQVSGFATSLGIVKRG